MYGFSKFSWRQVSKTTPDMFMGNDTGVAEIVVLASTGNGILRPIGWRFGIGLRSSSANDAPHATTHRSTEASYLVQIHVNNLKKALRNIFSLNSTKSRPPSNGGVLSRRHPSRDGSIIYIAPLCPAAALPGEKHFLPGFMPAFGRL